MTGPKVMKITALTEGHGTGPTLCGAKLRQGDGWCKKTAGWGTSHPGTGRCRLHGGKTPTQTTGALRTQAVEKANDAVRKLGYTPVENPYTALLEVAGEVTAVKDFLRGEVERLEAIRYQGGSGEQIRGELTAYQAALRDTVNVLAVIGRLDITAQLVRLNEAQAALLVTTVNGAIADAGIRDDQAVVLRRALAVRLRAGRAEPQ